MIVHKAFKHTAPDVPGHPPVGPEDPYAGRMPHLFDADALAGVLGHMNRDHADDNLLIVRAFGEPGFTAATMTGFDGDGGDWSATRADGSATDVRVPWPGGSISERREVRREVVALYDAACARLGVAPRPHT